MRDLPPTTSASQMVTYAMCPRLYRYRYVDHVEPEFRSLALALGSATHSAIGWWFEERLDGRRPTVEEAEHIFSADLVAEVTGARIRWKDETPEGLEQKGLTLVRAYLESHGDMSVVGVEQRFEVDILHPETGEVLPRPLVGYFDLVVDRGDSVVEVKTSSKAWHPGSLDRHLQIGSYVTAANALHGGPAEILVHVIVKTKKPRVEEYRVSRGEFENGWFYGAAKAIEEAIRAHHFPPAPGPTCPECEFGRTCLADQGEVVVLRPRPVARTGRHPPRLPAVPVAV